MKTAMSNMTKSQLVSQLATRFPRLALLDVEEAVGLILKKIMEEVEQCGRVEIRGFGVFSSTLGISKIQRSKKFLKILNYC